MGHSDRAELHKGSGAGASLEGVRVWKRVLGQGCWREERRECRGAWGGGHATWGASAVRVRPTP